MKGMMADARLIITLAVWAAASLYVALGQPGWMMLVVSGSLLTYGILTLDRHSTVLRSNPTWPSIAGVIVGGIGVCRSVPSVLRSVGNWLESVFGWLAFSPIIGIAVVVSTLLLIFAVSGLLSRPKQ